MIRLHKLNVFVCSSLCRVFRPFIILQALPPSPKFCSPFLHHAVKRRLIPKGFNEVIMNLLPRKALLTEVLYNWCNFNFVYFLSLTYPSPVCSKFLLKSVALKFFFSSKDVEYDKHYQLIMVLFNLLILSDIWPRT